LLKNQKMFTIKYNSKLSSSQALFKDELQKSLKKAGKNSRVAPRQTRQEIPLFSASMHRTQKNLKK